MDGATSAEAWVTDDDLRAARERFAANIPGYVMPAAYGVARKDGSELTFGYINPFGSARLLPAVVLASITGYVATTKVVPMDRELFAAAIERLTPAEAAIHLSHPNLWSWRELLSGGDADCTFLAFFVVSADDAVLDENDQRFRRLAAA
jgi:hypothetical protein